MWMQEKGSVCGPSCKCHNCTNTHITSGEWIATKKEQRKIWMTIVVTSAQILVTLS